MANVLLRPNSIWTNEYYKYCKSLIESQLDDSATVILGRQNAILPGTLRLDIQSEHTLVKPGGRDSDDAPMGRIDFEGGHYLVRIPDYEYYLGLDATIEYSLPNIANIESHGGFSEYLDTALYVPPLLYDECDFAPKNRTSIISMSNPSPRREIFQETCPHVLNIQNRFSLSDLKRVYDDAMVMVNTHQTDHHHTFEELRVLPALCNGVIVVSEDVPLKDKIPYSDFIVWSSYKDLAATVKDVQDNYDQYRRNIFTNDLADIISGLRENNSKIFRTFFEKML